MDEQLLNLDYNIEDLDEAFIKMDEEIAKTISEDDTMEGFEDDDVFERPNPFDNWEREAYSAIPDLLQLDSILAEPSGQDADVNLEQFGLENLENLAGLENTLQEFNLEMLEDPQVRSNCRFFK